MFDSPTTTVWDDSEQLGSNCPCDAEILSFELDVAGKTVPFRINVVSKQATLADIVPLARTIADKLILTFLDTLGRTGQSIPCQKGCSACCSRYLVPLSVPEMFRLREELLAMPADNSRQILQSCLDTAEKILDSRFQTSYLKSFSKSGQSQISQISKWYAGLKLACPLLSDGLCMSYEQRPLACREHMVTGSNFFCQPDHNGEPNVAPMPVSVLEAIGQLAAELENLDIEAVMLPLAFAWVEDNLWRSRRTWPAVTMVKRFVEILELTASKNSAMPALST
jgi:Fe-S-cluster containining protein